MRKHISNILALVFLLSIATASKGQTTIDNDTIKVDGNPYALMVPVKGGMFFENLSIRNLEGKELIYLKYAKYTKPNTNKYSSSDETNVIYYEILFIETHDKAEIGSTELGFALLSKSNRQKKIAEIITSNGLIKDNSLDKSAVSTFVFKYGTKYSDEKKELDSQKGRTIIIIDD